MSDRLTPADITRHMYDSLVAVCDGNAPERFDSGAKIYADLQIDYPVGKVTAMLWMDEFARSTGIRVDSVIASADPKRDYTIGQIREALTAEAERQGRLAA